MFASGNRNRFSLFDFSSHIWKELNELGDADPTDDMQASIPAITLDLWFQVDETDLYLVLPLLPSTEWEGSQVGLRIEFAAHNSLELLRGYRAAKQAAADRVAAVEGGVGSYVPWPKSLTHYLEKELHAQFGLRYFVLDRARFDGDFVARGGYEPAPLAGELAGKALIDSLIRVDFLEAQRHLGDRDVGAESGGGRSEHLSRRLSRFYKRNLAQREDDHGTLKALSDSEAGLNLHLKEVFEKTLGHLADLGYPGLGNPRLEIQSAAQPGGGDEPGCPRQLRPRRRRRCGQPPRQLQRLGVQEPDLHGHRDPGRAGEVAGREGPTVHRSTSSSSRNRRRTCTPNSSRCSCGRCWACLARPRGRSRAKWS